LLDTRFYLLPDQMSKNSYCLNKRKRVAEVVDDQLIVPPRVRRGGGSAVALWQALSSAMMAWILPEVLVCLVWEYSFSFIPRGILYLVFLWISFSAFRQDDSCGALVSGDQSPGSLNTQLQSQRLTSACLWSIAGIKGSMHVFVFKPIDCV
jgi:hypothetical protein